MERGLRVLPAALVVVGLPAVLLGNALWALLGPWLVDAQYALPGFPGDRFGLDDGARAELASAGVRAVHPLGDGAGALERETLPSGRAAFGPGEIRHMADVRDLVAGIAVAWLAGLCLVVPSALVLRRRGGRAARRALARGALVTLAATAALALVGLLAFDALFTAFHGVFFEGDSWRFADGETLRRLYPDAFWAIAGAALAALALLQAGALLLLGRDRG